MRKSRKRVSSFRAQRSALNRKRVSRKRMSRKRVSRKRVSPFRAQRSALNRKRVSRKRVSPFRAQRSALNRKRVSKRSSRRRGGRKNINYRMYGHAGQPTVLWGHDYTKRVPCSRPLSFLANARYTGKLWEHDYTKPVSSREVFLRKIGNVVPPLPDDTRGLIFEEFCRQKFKRKARFMDATVYLYGGCYGYEATAGARNAVARGAWPTERYFELEEWGPYDEYTTKIDDDCERYSNKHKTTIEKFININNLKPGDILFVGSHRTVEEQDGSQNGFGFVTNKIRGRISRKLTFTYSENARSGRGIRYIIWEGREKFGKYVNYKRALSELIDWCEVGRGADLHCGSEWDSIPEGWCEHDGQCEEQEMCQEYLEELEKPWVDTKGILGPPGQKFVQYDNYLFFGQQDPYHWIGELFYGEPINIRTPLAKDPELQEMLGYHGQYIIDSEGKPTEEWVPLLEKYANIPIMRREWCDPDDSD